MVLLLIPIFGDAHSRYTEMNSKQSKITSEDILVSATLSDLPSLLDVLKHIKYRKLKSLLDLGCGYGGLTMYIANQLNIDEVYGVDIDEKRLSKANEKGVITYSFDLNKEKLGFPDESFDLITSFGALEHLIYFDNFFIEIFRVLRKDGYLLIAMPNLGSYINRIGLLFGFQPRDVEISSKSLDQGFLPGYNGAHLGHIHSATLRSIKKLLINYGFNIVKINSSSPYANNKVVKILDKIFFIFPSWSRRFIILAKKR